MMAQSITIYVVKTYNYDGKLVPYAYCINKTVANKIMENAKGFHGERAEIEEVSLIMDVE